MKKHFLCAALSGALLATLATQPGLAKRDEPGGSRDTIQLALLLDTSNSMDGLIDQAKSQLWKVVNEFSEMKKDGKVPRLEVALYQYGNDGLNAREGYVQQVVSFTTDLDKVSEQLFKLKTNGGEEYCGWVMRSALKQLSWSDNPKDIRVMFIAGNEPFSQGTVNYKEVCASARQKDVLVNTIFCGPRGEGVETAWSDGARLGGGDYLCIDQDRKVVDIPTPYDAELATLSTKVNETYVAYGDRGGAGRARQEEQDKNAVAAAPSVAAQRASTKAGANYSNAGWDLVDASREGEVDVRKVPKDQLPAEMQSMNEGERAAYVEKKSRERSALQARIRELSAKRDAFLAEKQKAASGEETLDEAMIKAVRNEAVKRGYTVPKS
ncbi:VWA domain-containing protein [bacterium CPR1]|nr:VWA domain-containing protein [bacterium CPR1]